MRKPAFRICENKDADQLSGNCEADQRLCFRYTDHIWQETTTFFTYHVFVTWVAWVTRVAGTEIPKLAFLCCFFIFSCIFMIVELYLFLFVINLITTSTFLFEFHCIFTPGKDYKPIDTQL